MQAFADIIDHIVNPMIEVLRTSFKLVSSQSPEIEDATYLGETVDQGLHPQGVEFRLYETAINKAWFVHVRRNPESRHVSMTSALDTSAETKPKAILPSKLVIVARHRDSGELDPPATWLTTIKAIWKRLRLTPELPDSVLHFASQGHPDMRMFRMRVVVKELSRRSKDGLRILADANKDHLTPDTPTLENRAPHSDATKIGQPAGMRMADGVAALPTLVGGNPITVAQAEDPNSLGESRQPSISAEPVDSLADIETIIGVIGDDNSILIYNIARDKSKSANVKLYEIAALDRRFEGFHSEPLAKLLNVTSNAIRGTNWWKEIQKKLHDDDDDDAR